MNKRVLLVQEWNFPALSSLKSIKRKSNDNAFFYVVTLRRGNVRFLKVGTTEQEVYKRFSAKDYQKYDSIKFLYLAEIGFEGGNSRHGCYHVEDLTRSMIRSMNGFTFVKNDRFKFFQLPESLPVVLNFDEIINIPTKNPLKSSKKRNRNWYYWKYIANKGKDSGK